MGISLKLMTVVSMMTEPIYHFVKGGNCFEILIETGNSKSVIYGKFSVMLLRDDATIKAPSTDVVTMLSFFLKLIETKKHKIGKTCDRNGYELLSLMTHPTNPPVSPSPTLVCLIAT